MRILFRPLVLIILLIMLTGMVSAGSKDVGTSAYSFLRVGVSARGQAMAGAMVALADDEYAGYYNPAGLGQLAPVYEIENEYGEVQEFESDITKYFAASYNNYIADIQSGYITFITRQGYGAMLGFSVNYFNYGTFDEIDINNVQTGTFSASEMAFGLNFGQRVDENLYWGLTGKFIYQKLQDYTSDGMAVDGGIIYRLKDKRTRIGLAARNIGVQLKGLTDEHKDKFPTSAHAGVSHELQGAPIKFSGQIDYPFDYDLSFKAGVEFAGLNPLLIRVGWDSMGKDYKSESSKDALGGFSGGLGYIWGNYRFDYSYSSFADIGDSHRISLAGGF
ncbi:MAG: PorV/PorQ family protein [candidate division Zixibacteria bacterium]|nr:PorV/PorQ family protein [candidate division Zixibacteria bacterium]